MPLSSDTTERPATAQGRRARLTQARLYLICDTRPGGRALEDVLGPALAGGVDIFQLRDKRAPRARLLAGARVARELCDAAGALLIVNDDPGVALETGADGLHVGQADLAPARARRQIGAELLLGVSTHAPGEIAAACADAAAAIDYIGVGPVHETPTKPGRAAVGVGLVEYAAAHASLPCFAIGGLNAGNVAAVLDAGARRIAVVRAIAHAPAPRAAAFALRELLDDGQP